MTHKLAMLLIMLFAAVPAIQAQDDPEYRMELGLGGGLTGYLGDFNGSLVKDLQPAATLVGRYYFNPWMAVQMGLGYGKMKGSTKDVETYYPDYADRTYEFSNKLYSLDAVFEYNFWPYGTGYDYRGAKRITPYVFGGLGMGYADTKEKGRVLFQLPIGVGMKAKLADRLNIGLAWAVHFTQSDWLDGVKDPYKIESSGLFKNTDCYSTLLLTLTYSFAPRCVNCNKE